ncbi:hypothetical protein FVEG_15837 [Fusarium verticillioides 7600]|uniref:Uncharacterized protein n=1 Tax=Gibberella moniliformis (strain M3125 / FGSC 7600) TaxID=334819 RepID=W7MLP6_GIBM7|nr:hypothetical protein FVEG_15837 [Fusarium verticillioides 7600]EWG45582.1 hypothetical protein FVEG_15837 [Fusarium verticillioides 7600]
MTPVIAPGGWKAQGTHTCAGDRDFGPLSSDDDVLSWERGPNQGKTKISLSQNLDSGVSDSHVESAGHQV